MNLTSVLEADEAVAEEKEEVEVAATEGPLQEVAAAEGCLGWPLFPRVAHLCSFLSFVSCLGLWAQWSETG